MNTNSLINLVLITIMMAVFSGSFAMPQHTATESLFAADELRKDSPVSVLQQYWDYSRIGDFKAAASLTRVAPKIYFTCKGLSSRECRLKAGAQSNPQSKARPGRVGTMIIDTDLSKIQEDLPNGIYKGFWSGYTIESVVVSSDQARLRIAVDGPGFNLRQDVLCFEEEGTWKIFAFVDAGEDEAFADAWPDRKLSATEAARAAN